MRSLDMDYKEGKISEEKYKYFRSKYEDKLSIVDAWDATNRIRSMQGKKSGEEKPNKSNLLNKKKKDNLYTCDITQVCLFIYLFFISNLKYSN